MKKFLFMLMVSTQLFAMPEIKVQESDQQSLTLTIYPGNMAFIQDSRMVSLEQGENKIIFPGLAEKILLGSSFVQSDKFAIESMEIEPLTTYRSLMDQTQGKEILVQNNGTLKKANLLSMGENPFVEMDNKVNPNFKEEIWINAPENFYYTPTLKAILKVAEKGVFPIDLGYLTKGLSYQAEYVGFLGDKLNLSGSFVIENKLKNMFHNATINLAYGNINIPEPHFGIRDKGGNVLLGAMNSDGGAIQSVNNGDFYIYTLPQKKEILPQSNSQVYFINNIPLIYKRIYKYNHLLTDFMHGDSFQNQNPVSIIEFQNETNMPLSAGIIRLFENNKEKTVLLGGGELPNLAENQIAEIEIGKAFDIYASGAVLPNGNTLNKNVEIEFTNASGVLKTVEYCQSLKSFDYQDKQSQFQVINENIPFIMNQKGEACFEVPLQPESTNTLKFELKEVSNQAVSKILKNISK